MHLKTELQKYISILMVEKSKITLLVQQSPPNTQILSSKQNRMDSSPPNLVCCFVQISQKPLGDRQYTLAIITFPSFSHTENT